MRELEKILEEIKDVLKDTYLDIANNYDVSDLRYDSDKVACVAGKFRCVASERIEAIVRKHMSGKDKDVPANNGWIPVGKFGLPRDNEHDFRFWITIQYANGFGRTIKAKWDCFDKCFIHQNGKKISQDVIAYKYYSLPEPYHPEPKLCDKRL